ncbi:MAG: hypothetical protein LBH90_09880 [Tannerella sp.]|nr:hypothetical protein [Tannerella sp.]
MDFKFVFCIGLFILVSCNRGDRYRIEQALYYAGENASELEKVLKHYSSDEEDRLKLKAAEFLIANMTAHFSYKNTEYVESYYNEIEVSVSLNNSNEENRNIIEQISKRYDIKKLSEYVPDVKVITAEYLISTIESAFDVLENGEWATHVSFIDFCEYILPYKGTEFQITDNWRNYSKELFTGDLAYLHYCDLYKNSVFQAATTVSKEIIKSNQQYWPSGGINAFPILKISTLAKMPFGSCGDYSTLALSVMRSKGIPVVQDFTPQWPFQAQGHTWNVLLDNNFKRLIFSPGSSNPGEIHKPLEKMAKVFRSSYAVNAEITAIRSSGEYVPAVFRNSCIKDVTDEYMNVEDVEMIIPSGFRGKYKYAYLAVFNNKDWIPVHYGKVSGKKVRFEKMGKNCVYLPVFYDEQGIVPFSSPFLLTATGEVKKIECDMNHLQPMTVRRKYFIAEHCYNVGMRLQGGKFQASNRADFSDAVTLHTIPDFTVQSGEVFPDTLQTPYRYWRYYSADEQHNNMAELYFYGEEDEPAVYGTVIGTDGSYTGQKRDEKEAVFDGDPLTYYDALTPSRSWVGMDFGHPVRIKKISYTPRGDGNDITPGDIHELFYWNNHQWNSTGKRQATDIRLVYENLPSGGLYLIRNLSRGRDERIFTYENGVQVWW